MKKNYLLFLISVSSLMVGNFVQCAPKGKGKGAAKPQKPLTPLKKAKKDLDEARAYIRGLTASRAQLIQERDAMNHKLVAAIAGGTQAEIEKLKRDLKGMNEQLKIKEDDLTQVTEKFDVLQRQFNEAEAQATQEKREKDELLKHLEALRQQAEEAKERAQRAEDAATQRNQEEFDQAQQELNNLAQELIQMENIFAEIEANYAADHERGKADKSIMRKQFYQQFLERTKSLCERNGSELYGRLAVLAKTIEQLRKSQGGAASAGIGSGNVERLNYIYTGLYDRLSKFQKSLNNFNKKLSIQKERANHCEFRRKMAQRCADAAEGLGRQQTFYLQPQEHQTVLGLVPVDAQAEGAGGAGEDDELAIMPYIPRVLMVLQDSIFGQIQANAGRQDIIAAIIAGQQQLEQEIAGRQQRIENDCSSSDSSISSDVSDEWAIVNLEH